MNIASIRIRNWMCFRGEHTIALEPKVYSVVGRYEANEERSNWSGKTALLEFVRFVLTGQHRFRTEDEFITDGETSMDGELVLTSGHRILRNRAAGKRTAVWFWEPGAKAPQMNDEAETAIAALIGLEPDDCDNTFFFAQKQMGKFVTAKPDARQKIVSAWFRLDPLERCEARARKSGDTGEASLRAIAGSLEELDRREKAILGSREDGSSAWSREKLLAAIPLAEAAVKRERAATGTLEQELESAAAAFAGKQRVGDFEAICRDGVADKARLAAMGLPARLAAFETAATAARADAGKLAIVQANVAQKMRLATGDFDGRCPVANITCPARETINADRRGNADALAAAKAEAQVVLDASRASQAAEQTARAAVQEAERLAVRVAELRRMAAQLKPIVDAAKSLPDPPDPSTIRARLDAAKGEMMQARSDVDSLKALLSQYDEVQKLRSMYREKAKGIETELATSRAAVAVFGKRGAQRRVAEGALATIEADANRELHESGVDLTVEVRWSREIGGLAKSCDACGFPFPPSAKVKICARCGVARGPNAENKLEITLSDRSGAAEDLGGGHFQLAASRWLREARGSAWSTALIDEPFGALDPANRKAMARHLSTMLPRFGFSQALIVSHSPDFNFAMPGRIEVVSGSNGSTARVVA